MGPWGALISLNTDTRTQSSAQPSIRDSASPGTSATLHLLEHTPSGVGSVLVFWEQGGRRAGFWHPASEKDRGEVHVFVAVAGKGLSCPARGGCEVVSQSGTRALSVGPALDWARSSRSLGSLLGTPLGASRPRPLAQLPRAFLGGSQWAHLPHVGCDPCLALCPLGLFPLLGAGSLTPQREDPVRGSCGHGSWCRQCVWGAGDWDRGLGMGGWGRGASRLSPWLHV